MKHSTAWLAVGSLMFVLNVVVFACGGNTNATLPMICIATAAILIEVEQRR